MNPVDCVVLGAGAVGLAAALAVARGGRQVVVIERERRIGMHTSARNSEVVHAGIHYAAGSLKARLCVAGRERLYRYCERHGIGYRRCGKMTVAASMADVALLENIAANARACGVFDLEWWERAEARRREPHVECACALHSPSSGIVDSQAYLQCLLGDAQTHGADIVYGTHVTALRPTTDGIEVCLDGDDQVSVRARTVINCAGLGAAAIAGLIAEFPRQKIPRIHYAKGSYFTVAGRAPATRLVYPVPGSQGHLGIHLTLDLAGRARLGPDLQWLRAPAGTVCDGAIGDDAICDQTTLDDSRFDYAVDAARAPEFAQAVRRYWPDLAAERLSPAYAGIRPKLSGPGEPDRDFLLSGPADHGVAGIVNLFGIDSPGLTASLELGDAAAAMLET